ncbi:MAG TPA: hypothetical protein VJU34_12595 [Phenylobacterium sp.]|nr:hypothetical protein [Phenylobacterium sp.]
MPHPFRIAGPRRMARSLAAVSVALAALAAASGGLAAPAALPDPNAYRRLDDKQLGSIDWIVSVANRPGGDWSGMGHSEPGQGGFDAYRYQLAMMSYTLDLANYHYTPAYRDLYQAADTALIDKMLREDVWGFWELTSRGSKGFDPSLTELGAGWIDPVKEQNIMYSGHLFQMVTTHAMLYNDATYEKPDAIRFVYDPVGRGMGKQVFSYNTASLADVLYKQFERSEWRGIECEPNAIFPECNQHPILGFAAMETRTPTGYYQTVSTHFKGKFDAMKYIDPKSNSFMMMYLKRQDKMIYNALPWSDGWAGAFMHAWSKADVEQVYPVQKANYVATLGDGTETVKAGGPRQTYSHDHGFFAVLAAEVGDGQTRNAFLAYADKYWKPKWDEDGLRYPRQDAFKRDGDPANVWRRVQVLTGNSLLGLARMNVEDGFYDIYNKPRGASAFAEPFISGVDYPQTKVARAVYDPSKSALIVTLRRAAALPTDGAVKAARLQEVETAWTINNLAAADQYEIWRDGHAVAVVKGGAVMPKDAAHDRVVIDAAGKVVVTSRLRDEATFIVVKE